MRNAPTACLLALLLAGGTPLHAQQSDPLKSPACGAALASLQSARSGGAEAARVESLRSAAATTCLGAGSPPSRPGRVLQAPIAVPPPQIDVAPAPALPIATMPPPPPIAIDRPATPAACDAGGCWVNDGTHLRQVTPDLRAPGGLCTSQGGAVLCP